MHIPDSIARSSTPLRRLVSPEKQLSWLLLAGFLLSLVACSQQDEGYFPLARGHSWDYLETLIIRGESHFRRRVITTQEPVRIEGKMLFVQEAQGGQRRYFSRTDAGIFRERPGTKQTDLILPLPLNENKYWTLISRLGVIESRTFAKEDRILIRPPPIKLEYSLISKDETVIVSAGRFTHCLKIKGKGTTIVRVDRGNGIAEVDVENYDWYAPGVGLVKTERIERSVSPFLKNGRYTLELLRFN